MIKRIFVALIIALCPVAIFAQDVEKEEVEDLTFGLDFTVDYFSKYIWRGQDLQDDGAIQPGFTLTYGNLSASIWGSIEMSNLNDSSGEITEIDYSLDYSDSLPGIEGVGYSLGVINYTFPNTKLDDTTEVYVGLSLDWPLSPSVTLYNDVDDVNGSYVSFGLSHSIDKIFEITPDLPVGLDISASFGWGSASYNKVYWGVDDSEMNDFALSIGFPMEIGGWSVSPSINYVTLMSGDIRDGNSYSNDDSFFFAGVSISKSF